MKKEKIKVLDIGCGDGHLLNLYRDHHGDKVETHGVDFNLEAVVLASAAGHLTYNGRFEDAKIGDNQFDLVVASHVIEHVSDPVYFAEKVFRCSNQAVFSGLKPLISVLLTPNGSRMVIGAVITSLVTGIFHTRHD